MDNKCLGALDCQSLELITICSLFTCPTITTTDALATKKEKNPRKRIKHDLNILCATKRSGLDAANLLLQGRAELRKLERRIQICCSRVLKTGRKKNKRSCVIVVKFVSTSDARIVWEESMRAALAVVEHTRIKHTLERFDCEDYNMLQTSHFHRNPPNQRASTFKRHKR